MGFVIAGAGAGKNTKGSSKFELKIHRADGRRGPTPTGPHSKRFTDTGSGSTVTGYYVATLPLRLTDEALALVRQGIELAWPEVATAQHVQVENCTVTSDLRVRVRTILTIECTFGVSVLSAARKQFVNALVLHALSPSGAATTTTSTTVTVDEDQVVDLHLPSPPEPLATPPPPANTGETARKRDADENGADISVADYAHFLKRTTAVLAPYGETFAPWHLDRIDQRDTNYDEIYTYWGNATGYTAYVIDTGVEPTHPEFQQPTGRVVALGNTLDGSGPLDCNGHGTHVTGILAGTYVGVAKGAHVRVVKALDCGGSGTTSSIVAALWMIDDDAVNGRPGDPNSPFVINLSVNGPMSQSLTDALQAVLQAHHVVIVAAAGNSASNGCNTAPAAVSGVLAIGASTTADQRASYSNYGTCVPRYAPGSAVTSSWLNGQYAVASGTSMAAPCEAGADLIVMGQIMDGGYQLGNTNLRTIVLSVMNQQASRPSTLDKPLLYAAFDASTSGTPPATTRSATSVITAPHPPPANPPPPPPPPALLLVAPPAVRKTSDATTVVASLLLLLARPLLE